jgi:Flp pilus assembly protein TadD
MLVFSRLMKRFYILMALTLSIQVYAQTESYVISGYVVDEQGRPLTNMPVRLSRVAVGQYFEAKTNSKGNYIRPDLPGGEYEVSVIIGGHSFVRATHVGVEDRFITSENTVQTNSVRPVVTVNFDLRELAARNRQQQQKVTLGALKIPRKAQDEFKKAFDAQDDIESAKRHLESAIRLAPNYEEALNNLGMIYSRGTQYTEAAALFERALAANPESIVVRLNLAATLFQQKHYEPALRENLRVLESDPNNALAHGQAGVSLSHLTRFDEAISHLQRAKELDSQSDFHPGYILAGLYDDLGRDEAAINEFAEFLKANPKYPGRSDIEYRVRQLCERHTKSDLQVCAR